jgi:hypothetical protein
MSFLGSWKEERTRRLFKTIISPTAVERPGGAWFLINKKPGHQKWVIQTTTKR